MAPACVETGGSYVNALALIGLWMAVEAAWMWLLHRTTPPGRWRLLLALPVIAVSSRLPLLFLRLAADACSPAWTAHQPEPSTFPLLAPGAHRQGNLATPRMFCRHQDVVMIIFTSFMTGWLTNYKVGLNREACGPPASTWAVERHNFLSRRNCVTSPHQSWLACQCFKLQCTFTKLPSPPCLR